MSQIKGTIIQRGVFLWLYFFG